MRLKQEDIAAVFKRFLSTSVVADEANTSYIFYDIHEVKNRIETLMHCFPADTLHAIAIKANPLPAILNMVQSLGIGAEVASLGELHLALHAGFSPESIVFDSPAKTREEIAFAGKTGVNINADNFDDLRRISEMCGSAKYKGAIGLRINPQVGAGDIASSGTAGAYSKFGIPLDECRQEIMDAFVKNKWLSGIHIHIGSQGCPLALLVAGVKRSVDFLCDLNRQLRPLGRHIEFLDIGGGLPVAYSDSDNPPTLQEYRVEIDRMLQKLDGPHPRIITEFGRYVYANAGWTASRVEYVKRQKSMATAVIHVGADLFLRRCYRPEDWHHDIFVVDNTGAVKTGRDTIPYTVAGPLCFSGDIIASEISLPPVEEGDYVIIRDTGAYTLSMWSRYNSRCMPGVIGYEPPNGPFMFLKEPETPNDVISFWS